MFMKKKKKRPLLEKHHKNCLITFFPSVTLYPAVNRIRKEFFEEYIALHINRSIVRFSLLSFYRFQ